MFDRIFSSLLDDLGPVFAALIVKATNAAVHELADLLDGKTDSEVQISASREPITITGPRADRLPQDAQP